MNEGGDCPIRRDGLCSTVITATEQLKNLTKWQESQNGHLQRIDLKLDGLKSWAISLLTGVAVAVILLAINLALKRI